MVEARNEFGPLKEFFANASSNDCSIKLLNDIKVSELIIEYFVNMLENGLADPLDLWDRLRSLNLGDILLYELTCAWTSIIKKKLSNDVDYKTVLAWIDGIHHNISSRVFSSSTDDICVQMKKFTLKYSAHLFGKGLCGLISSNAPDEIVQMTSLLDENPLLTVALHDIVWAKFSRCLERSILFITKSTGDILMFVVQSIKILLKIDKSGTILEKFLRLSRNYLQTHRKATLGTKVLSLILRFSHANMPIKPRVYYDVPDIDQRNFDSVMFGNIRGSTKTGDIFCILANFLDSSEELVYEYKRHLIKLMHNNSNSSDVIAREMTIELDKMKKKFAGDEWRECEVLIHDFEASMNLKAGPLELFRISRIYWPEFEPKSFFLPCNQLQSMSEAIIERAAEKDHRKVYDLTNSCSHVDLDLEFLNTTISVSCDADEASILMLLSQLKSAYFGELQKITGFQFDRLKQALCVWVRKGIVLWHDHDRFLLVEEYIEVDEVIDCQPYCWKLHTEEESEKTNLQIASKLKRLIPLICGVLSNLGPMPLGILHAHLQKVSLGFQSAEYDLYLLLESHVTAGVLYLTAEGFYHVTNKI